MRSLISITVLFFFGVFGCGGGDRAAPPDAGAPDLVEPDRETPDTYVASCGNGVRDPGEECDDGSRNSNSAPDACRTSCRLASCGDGVRDSREQCDQGQRNSNTEPDACRMNCALARCGDNVRDASEQCEGEASQSCAPACGSTGVQRCLNCVWDSCIATDDVCDDGNPCTVADSCLGNACMGTPMTCTTPPTATCLDDVTLRTYAATGACSAGVCNYTATDTTCNDSNACTTDACASGACVTAPITCNDSNLCTDDSCDPARGCVFTPNTLACNDGNLCTVADTCSGGSCAGTPMTCATPPSAVCVDDATLRTYAATGACSAGVCNYTVTDTTCNDSNACTADSCVSGVCVYTPITCTTPPVAVCADDATLRTYAETGMCAGGVCSYTLTDTTCNDSNACTTDSCLAGMCMTAPITCTTPPLAVCVSGTVRRTYAATGACSAGVCNYTATDTTCNDSNACTTDACASGACVTAPITCNDSNLCTDDSCDPARGCVFTPNTLACNDGNLCTVADRCASGSCMGTPMACTTPPAAMCLDSATLRTYSAVGACSAGICNYTQTDTVCNDSNACTTDSCASGACVFIPAGCWAPVTTISAPTARFRHTAVWTGTEMIVWGGSVAVGYPGGEVVAADGGRYNPLTDSWVSIGGGFGRAMHTAIWTGSEMIGWGGVYWWCVGSYCFPEESSQPGDRYNPTTNTWATITTAGAPTGRTNHTAVWTGTEMIVWGGLYTNDFPPPGTEVYLASGGRYNPSTNTWSAISSAGAPSPRAFHTAVWTGTEMIVWGGYCRGVECGGSWGVSGTGARYDPVTNAWRVMASTGAPSAREQHTVVWTGSEMIVWGGEASLNTGGQYDPVTDRWLPITTSGAPLGRRDHTAVWTGSEMIVWGGRATTSYFNTGGWYDPFVDVWETVVISGAPTARAQHTAVWTGSEMIVWGGSYLYGGNTGGRYTPP